MRIEGFDIVNNPLVLKPRDTCWKQTMTCHDALKSLKRRLLFTTDQHGIVQVRKFSIFGGAKDCLPFAVMAAENVFVRLPIMTRFEARDITDQVEGQPHNFLIGELSG
jgi:hypothetical protein